MTNNFLPTSRHRRKWLDALRLIVLLTIASEAAGGDAPAQCAGDEKHCAWEAALKHPAWTVAFWQADLAKPLERRIGAPPPALVEFLNLGSIVAGDPNRPHAAPPDADFMRDVHEAIAELPEIIKGPLRKKLAGIFLVDDLYGSAWSDQIFEHNLQPLAERKAVAGMLALNVSALRGQTANSWATWKENTPFAADPRFRLTVQIADAADDNRKNAIQYLLLHEIGHIFAIGNDIHPSPNLSPRDVRSTAEFPFFLLSWNIAAKENRYVTLFDDTVFPQRRSVAYYGKPKLRADDMAGVYENLERTNLPTLYGALHPADDFAEAFVTYVHTVILRKPFVVTVYENGAIAKTYIACWESPRCVEKRKLLERVIRDGK